MFRALYLVTADYTFTNIENIYINRQPIKAGKGGYMHVFYLD